MYDTKPIYWENGERVPHTEPEVYTSSDARTVTCDQEALKTVSDSIAIIWNGPTDGKRHRKSPNGAASEIAVRFAALIYKMNPGNGLAPLALRIGVSEATISRAVQLLEAELEKLRK